MKKIWILLFTIVTIMIVAYLGFSLTHRNSNNKENQETSRYSKISSSNEAPKSNSETDTNNESNFATNTSSTDANNTSSADDSDTYVNAYGHTIKKGEEDNTGEAIRDREHNVDIENIKYLVGSSLTPKQKEKQLNSWQIIRKETGNGTETLWTRDGEVKIGTFDKSSGNITME